MFTVGPVAGELLTSFRRDGSDRALIVDPGDEADRLLGAIDDARASTLDGDPAHAHALRPRRRGRAGGAGDRRAESGCPRSRRPVLADIMSYVPWPGFGPFESLRRRAHARGRRAARARRLRDRRALHARPQPRPRDLLDPGRAGDLLRRRAVPGLGRPHRPARRRLAARCSSRSATLVDSLPDETAVYPGHMGITTLGAERATNPFLAELRAGERTLQAPRGTFDVLPDDARRATRLVSAGRASVLEARRATSRSRRRSSRTPSCSRAAWGSPPTSSRRRCSPSRTRPAAR